jgi:hypothetical protein
MPQGSTGQFGGVDPFTNNPITVTNVMTNFGWEYVWHCHLLGHEENDMMRPIVFQVSPAAPSNLTAVASLAGTGAQVALAWVNNATTPAALTFTIQRATNATFTAGLTTLPSVPVPAVAYTDLGLPLATTYFYRVRAENAAGYSAWSNTATVTTPNRTMHVGALTGARNRPGALWTATVTITARDGSNAPLSGVAVTGSWVGGIGGSTGCTTNAAGTCQVTRTVVLPNNSVTYTVNSMTRATYTYVPASNTPNPARVTVR